MLVLFFFGLLLSLLDCGFLLCSFFLLLRTGHYWEVVDIIFPGFFSLLSVCVEWREGVGLDEREGSESISCDFPVTGWYRGKGGKRMGGRGKGQGRRSVNTSRSGL